MDQSENPGSDGLAASLSDRQTQCLALAAEGLTSKEIGRRIGVSPSTVDNHLRAAADRLQVRGRREAVRFFIKDGERRAPPKSALGEPPEAVSRWSLPPIGGRPNRLPVHHRFMQVIVVALIGTMALAAITFTISGVVRVLDLR